MPYCSHLSGAFRTPQVPHPAYPIEEASLRGVKRTLVGGMQARMDPFPRTLARVRAKEGRGGG